jgi:hypothetical protein
MVPVILLVVSILVLLFEVVVSIFDALAESAFSVLSLLLLLHAKKMGKAKRRNVLFFIIIVFLINKFSSMEIPKTLCQLKCRIKNIDNTKYAEEKLQKLQSKINNSNE